MRLRLLGSASIIVLLSACGSDAAGTRPSIAASFEPVGSLEIPVRSDVGALPPASAPVEQPPAQTAPVEPTAPAAVTDTTPTAAEVPSDEGSGATWWPWVVVAVVVVGAILVFVRRRPTGPSWQTRTTSLLDEVEQLSSHLVALTPDGLHAVAPQDAARLATLRATLRELTESAPDTASRSVLTGLGAPIADLHSAIDALALSAGPSSTPAGTAVPSLAAQLHTVSTSARAQLALHR